MLGIQGQDVVVADDDLWQGGLDLRVVTQESYVCEGSQLLMASRRVDVYSVLTRLSELGRKAHQPRVWSSIFPHCCFVHVNLEQGLRPTRDGFVAIPPLPHCDDLGGSQGFAEFLVAGAPGAEKKRFWAQNGGRQAGPNQGPVINLISERGPKNGPRFGLGPGPGAPLWYVFYSSQNTFFDKRADR